MSDRETTSVPTGPSAPPGDRQSRFDGDRRPFPESELPRWLAQQVAAAAAGLWRAIRPTPFRQLSQFSHQLATCAASSADLARGLELCLKPLRQSPLGNAWSNAAAHLRGGQSLEAALRPGKDCLPTFYLPVIAAGEQTGRLVEALQFLENHCRLLAGPAAALRNLWLIPLAVLVAGAVIRSLLFVVFGEPLAAVTLLATEFLGWLQLAVIAAVVLFTPLRRWFDELRLAIPLLGEFERELSLHRFFRILALMYSVGEYRVEAMIRVAADSVSNQAARGELLKAAAAIERQASVEEAFTAVGVLTSEERTTIEVAELSGSLERAFEQISDDCGASVTAKIGYVQPILYRIVFAVVAFAVASTALRLAFAVPR